MTQKTSLFIVVITIVSISSQEVLAPQNRMLLRDVCKPTADSFRSDHSQFEVQAQYDIYWLNLANKRKKRRSYEGRLRDLNKTKRSFPRGSGAALLWGVENGDVSWVKDRLHKNDDFVEDRHITAIRKKINRMQIKLAQLKSRGDDDSYAADMHRLRLQECKGILSDLEAKRR